jgi:hypothetical protein
MDKQEFVAKAQALQNNNELLELCPAIKTNWEHLSDDELHNLFKSVQGFADGYAVALLASCTPVEATTYFIEYLLRQTDEWVGVARIFNETANNDKAAILGLEKCFKENEGLTVFVDGKWTGPIKLAICDWALLLALAEENVGTSFYDYVSQLQQEISPQLGKVSIEELQEIHLAIQALYKTASP